MRPGADLAPGDPHDAQPARRETGVPQAIPFERRPPRVIGEAVHLDHQPLPARTCPPRAPARARCAPGRAAPRRESAGRAAAPPPSGLAPVPARAPAAARMAVAPGAPRARPRPRAAARVTSLRRKASSTARSISRSAASAAMSTSVRAGPATGTPWRGGVRARQAAAVNPDPAAAASVRPGDMYVALRAGRHAVQVRRGAVAEDGSRAAGEYRRHLAVVVQRRRVPHAVDPPMDAVQPAPPDPAVEGPRGPCPWRGPGPARHGRAGARPSGPAPSSHGAPRSRTSRRASSRQRSGGFAPREAESSRSALTGRRVGRLCTLVRHARVSAGHARCRPR